MIDGANYFKGYLFLFIFLGGKLVQMGAGKGAKTYSNRGGKDIRRTYAGHPQNRTLAPLDV